MTGCDWTIFLVLLGKKPTEVGSSEKEKQQFKTGFATLWTSKDSCARQLLKQLHYCNTIGKSGSFRKY